MLHVACKQARKISRSCQNRPNSKIGKGQTKQRRRKKKVFFFFDLHVDSISLFGLLPVRQIEPPLRPANCVLSISGGHSIFLFSWDNNNIHARLHWAWTETKSSPRRMESLETSLLLQGWCSSRESCIRHRPYMHVNQWFNSRWNWLQRSFTILAT